LIAWLVEGALRGFGFFVAVLPVAVVLNERMGPTLPDAAMLIKGARMRAMWVF
jgi:hypothetical protein